MDDLNGYVILAGVLLIFAVLAYAGYTDLVSRIRKWKTRKWKTSKSKTRRSKMRKRNAGRREKDLA